MELDKPRRGYNPIPKNLTKPDIIPINIPPKRKNIYIEIKVK